MNHMPPYSRPLSLRRHSALNSSGYQSANYEPAMYTAAQPTFPLYPNAPPEGRLPFLPSVPHATGNYPQSTSICAEYQYPASTPRSGRYIPNVISSLNSYYPENEDPGSISPPYSLSSTCALQPPRLSTSSDLPEPVLSQDTVEHAMNTLRSSGIQACVDQLLSLGKIRVAFAERIPTIARGIKDEISKVSTDRAKCFGSHIRFGATSLFRGYWKLDNDWDSEDAWANGLAVAALIGSLFSVGLVFVEDVNLCLELLIDESRPTDAVLIHAIHLLVTCANEKLCKQKNLAFMNLLRTRMETIYLTLSDGGGPESELLQEVVCVIGRWCSRQMKNEGNTGGYVNGPRMHRHWSAPRWNS